MAERGQRDTDDQFESFIVVVFGASGDLAKKKTYPALFQLYCAGLLPRNVQIIGFARSAKYAEGDAFREHIKPGLKGIGGYLDGEISLVWFVVN